MFATAAGSLPASNGFSVPEDVRCGDGNFDEFCRNGFAFGRQASRRIAKFNVAADAERILSAIEAVPELRIVESFDGRSSLVQQGDNPLDQSARTEQFDYHTDGLYLARPPVYCALHCVDPGAAGIDTHFVDSRDVLAQLAARGFPRSELQKWKQSYINRKGALTTYGILSRHPHEHFDVLQYSCGKGGLSRESRTDVAGAGDMMQLLDTIIRNAPSIRFRWSRDDLVIWDNYTYLHGRFGSGIDARRKLIRFWIDPYI